MEKVQEGEGERTKRQFEVACIPAYNEERNIAKVILSASKHVDLVIVCDDGSSDMTADIAEKMGALVVRHHKNEGYGAALKTAFLEAIRFKPDIIVTLDGDGQHSSSDIPALKEKILSKEAEVVIGSRFLNEKNGVSKYRTAGIKSVNVATNGLAKIGLTDTQSGLRAYSGRAIQLIAPKMVEVGMGASLSILMKANSEGFRIVEVPASVNYNTGGKTSKKNSLSHGLELFMSLLTLVTEQKPIVYIGIPAFLSLVVGIGSLVVVIDMFNASRILPVGTALLAIAATLVGLILGSLAIFLHAMNRRFRELESARSKS